MRPPTRPLRSPSRLTRSHPYLRVRADRAKKEEEESGDLLYANPNHAGGAWRPHHSDDDDDGSDEGRFSAEEETVEEDFEVDALGNRIEKTAL